MTPASRSPTSAAVPLALIWAALVAYASLAPFTGWRWPPGADVIDLLRLPWVGPLQRFDVIANLLGYVPLGFLLRVALARNGAVGSRLWTGSVLTAAFASYALEVAQHLLPPRVPSLVDWLLNSAGALIGAGLAALFERWGWVGRISAARARWLAAHRMAVVLLLLWPVALLFPAPVPLGLGQIGARLKDAAQEIFGEVIGGEPGDWLGSVSAAGAPLSPVAEWLAVSLGLVGPCLVAYAASAPRWRRLSMAVGALILAVATMTLSTAMNFGPDHALAWRTPTSMAGLLTGAVVAASLAPVPARLAAGLGLIVITASVALIWPAAADPYYAQSLQAWEQGRFIRFHGLAQWVGWLWPYAAMAWLLVRVSARD